MPCCKSGEKIVFIKNRGHLRGGKDGEEKILKILEESAKSKTRKSTNTI